MTITIRHRTAYTFAAPVFLEPHLVRLQPRSDGAVRLLDFALEIEPPPAMRADNLDLDGNVVTHAWFEGLTTELRLCTRARVETLRADPFRFLLAEPERSLPYVYAAERAAGLQQYRSAPDAAHPEVRALALAAARDAERDQVLFPLELARRLHREFTVQARPEGPPQPPETTLATRRGACRDLTVLFVAGCRTMGLAARFASGYAAGSAGAGDELHAWGEVYLSGGGWRGYDPSQGLAVAESARGGGRRRRPARCRARDRELPRQLGRAARGRRGRPGVLTGRQTPVGDPRVAPGPALRPADKAARGDAGEGGNHE